MKNIRPIRLRVGDVTFRCLFTSGVPEDVEDGLSDIAVLLYLVLALYYCSW